MKFLLDTCAFLWKITGDERFSENAERLYRDEDNEFYLSSVSSWEISLKYSRGKLKLPAPPEKYIPKQRQKHGIENLPLDEESSLYRNSIAEAGTTDR